MQDSESMKRQEPKYPLATALRACLRSGDPLLRQAAMARISAAIQHAGGNAVRAAKELGVSHRSLMRWQDEDPEVGRILADYRADAGRV